MNTLDPVTLDICWNRLVGVVNEGVPDRFNEMLRQLDEKKDQSEKGAD